MNEIILKKLRLENFKGVKNLEIDFSGDTTISGANATGKTTIFDAFSWLLFDKDSANRSTFGIKTYDDGGEVIHGLDHTVEGDLTVGEKPIKLKKVYSEIWTKKRGSTSETFSGHTTDYYVNEVPVKKGDYEKRIAEIISEERFKLLANPHHFNEVLDKKERREIILGLEEVEDTEIIKTMNPEPKELAAMLGDYTLDEVRAIASSTMRKANKDLQELPVRIDELIRQVKDLDFKALEKEKESVQGQLDLVNGALVSSKALLERLEAKTRLISSKKLELDQLEGEAKRRAQRLDEEAEANLREWSRDKQEAEERKAKHIAMIDLKTEILEFGEKELYKARAEWEEIHSLEAPSELICKYCGQGLPQEDQEEAIKAFNAKKSADLEEAVKYGKEVVRKIEKIKRDLEESGEEIALAEEKLKTLDEIGEPTFEPTPVELPMEYYALEKEIKELEKDLLEGEKERSDTEAQARKKELQNKLSELESQLSAKARNKEIKKRIKDLEGEEKTLAKAYEDGEKLLSQVDGFIKTKAEMISGRVNAHFKHLTFKLFDVQVNGGLTETCEALINGVPYSDANNAGKINAGIDIINTLSKIYKTTVPVFIDNAESVNKLIKTDSQVIKLVVSDDKKLKIS